MQITEKPKQVFLVVNKTIDDFVDKLTSDTIAVNGGIVISEALFWFDYVINEFQRGGRISYENPSLTPQIKQPNLWDYLTVPVSEEKSVSFQLSSGAQEMLNHISENNCLSRGQIIKVSLRALNELYDAVKDGYQVWFRPSGKESSYISRRIKPLLLSFHSANFVRQSQ